MRKPVNADAQRKRELGQIHRAKAALQMDEEAYRSLLRYVTGKSSSADMTADERRRVLAEFAAKGWRPAPLVGRPAADRLAASPMLRKVEALLADRRLPWGYAHSMAKRMFEVERVEWLPDAQLHSVVAALEKAAWRQRRGL